MIWSLLNGWKRKNIWVGINILLPISPYIYSMVKINHIYLRHVTRLYTLLSFSFVCHWHVLWTYYLLVLFLLTYIMDYCLTSIRLAKLLVWIWIEVWTSLHERPAVALATKLRKYSQYGLSFVQVAHLAGAAEYADCILAER